MPAALCSQIYLPNQTAATGSSILFPMTFVADGGSVSGVQLDLEYDAANMSLTTTVGDVLTQLEKDLHRRFGFQ